MDFRLSLALSAALAPLLLTLSTFCRANLSKRRVVVILLVAFISAACLLSIELFNCLAGGVPPVSGWFCIDKLASVMLVLITSISMITLTYSHTFLEGDANRSRFICLSGFLASIMSLLVTSGNVFLLAVCWCLTTPILAALTSHCETFASRRASRKLITYHLISDICFVAAMLCLASLVGSFDIAKICSSVVTIPGHRIFAPAIDLVSVLIVLSALIKSAVFPFHGWLFGTLEAPTTFSAFLHAGLVNIAGFVSFRLAPVIFSSSIAPCVFVAFGLISAAVAALCSLAQPDVKSKLVFSTVAQMGFMCLQCGLGAYSSALLHLVCHGYFKCFLFLNAGNAISSSKSQLFEVESKSTRYWTLALIALWALMVISIFKIVASVNLLPVSIFTASLIYELLRVKTARRISIMDIGTRLALPICVLVSIYAGASIFFSSLFGGNYESPLVAPTLILFCGLMLIFWSVINAREKGTAFKDWLYVFAMNGGYLSRG